MKEATVEITDLAFGGNGVGRIDGKAVFVPFTAPGDEATVRLVSEKTRYSEAALIGLNKKSSIRVDAPCRYFGRCGGCNLQHINYRSQVDWKQKTLTETLARIGGLANVPFDEPAPSIDEFHYRSRSRIHVKGGQWGFFEHASHRIVDIDACPLLDERLNAALSSIKKFFLSSPSAPKDALSALTAVEVFLSPADSAVTASIHISRKTPLKLHELLKETGLKGVELKLVDKKGAGPVIASIGDDMRLFTVGGLKLRAKGNIFTQVNLRQNDALVAKVLDFSGCRETDQVIDLYCGAGNLSLPLAMRARSVIGVEAHRAAIAQAAENAELNSITNTRFVPSDASVWLSKNTKDLEDNGIDVLVLDPPRYIDGEIIKQFKDILPPVIVYVSCNPPSLARDAAGLVDIGYSPFRAAMIDMFPQTHHIECVMGFRR